MAYKEWEPDEFLDEFLEFDYSHKPGKEAKGLPAKEVKQTPKEQNRYGLGDDYKLYEELRHGSDRSAGTTPAAPAESKGLRSSDALYGEILEPLSARKPVKSAKSSTAAKSPDTAKAVSSGSVKQKAEDAAGAGQASPDKKSALSAGAFFRKKFGNKHASELASDALDAAKKLVHNDEDTEPETVPAASAASFSDLEGIAPASAPAKRSKADSRKKAENVTDPAEPALDFNYGAGAPAAAEKDELAELFAELGEPADHTLSSEENDAIAQAQSEAYDRYRGNYLKGLRKKAGSSKVGWFPKWLSRIYVIAAVAFAGMMTILNVLPFGMLIAFFVVLAFLSFIIVMQLRRERSGKGIRILASLTAIFLICCFGVGTAYSLGTLSFLDTTSVDNANRVASVTREPFNVCITGIDVDGTIDEQGRSDVNMIVTVNPKTEQILMTSIPRDYEIYMPDKDNAMDKLTHTGFYSVETTIGAEEQLLDTKINYYVKVNFTTVKEFIDAVGGVDVYSEYEFTPVKMKDWTVQEGWNHMNGKQALAFARERKAFADGDNQRIKNQQAVMEAVIKKATSSKTMVLSYNKILNNLRDYFKMSFSSGELRSLIRMQIAKDPEWKIYKNTIIGGDGSLPTYTTGGAYAYVMTQDQESIDNAKTLINAVLEGKLLDKDDDDNVIVAAGQESGEDGETEG